VKKINKIYVKTFFLCLLICLFFINYAAFAEKTFPAIVDHVVDGDTVWIKKNGKKIKLRLLGIDTPEKYPGRKLYRDSRMCRVKQRQMKWLGKLASRHAKELLTPGQKVTVKVYGKGFYGRKLAVIILPDGTNFNEKMVKDGYSCVYRYRGHKSSELPQEEWEKLNALLNQARNERRGLWEKYYNIMQCLCY